MQKIDYKFNEDVVLEYLKHYIDKTYEAHYAQGKIQATEFIFDSEHGKGFCLGNIMKYAQRYGKKAGDNSPKLVEAGGGTKITREKAQEQFEEEKSILEEE